MKLLFLLLISFLGNRSYSQKKDSILIKNHGFIFTSGFSIGNETVIGTPMLDIYKEFGSTKIKPYVGVGGSIFFFFAAWGSINTQAGLRFKNFTVDTSLARWKYTPSPNEKGVSPINFGPFSHSSWNPKIGFRKLNKKREDFWFKIGPSFLFNQNNGNSLKPFDFVNLFTINGLNLNAEFSVALKF